MKKLRQGSVRPDNIQEAIDEGLRIIKEYPELTLSDINIEMSYANCYYEGDTPDVVLEYYTEETESEKTYRLKQEETRRQSQLAYQQRIRNEIRNDTVKIINPPVIKA